MTATPHVPPARTVWKYPLYLLSGYTTVHRVPVGAVARHVGVQDDLVYLWIEVNPSAQHEDRTFHVVGTGNSLPHPPEGSALHYLGTVQKGVFVWHVYEPRRVMRDTGVAGMTDEELVSALGWEPCRFEVYRPEGYQECVTHNYGGWLDPPPVCTPISDRLTDVRLGIGLARNGIAAAIGQRGSAQVTGRWRDSLPDPHD